jgi:tRNA A-37 threonylcarbamoyl transferase component Bud32/WD40 repeat protein
MTDRSSIVPDAIPFGRPAHPGDVGTLGPYRVLRPLGTGGMGAVFLGYDPTLRRKVALKVMRPPLLARPGARDRFVREARAVAAVRSPHVVTVYEVAEANGLPYIALEYLSGRSLAAHLAGGPPPDVAQAVRVGREVALGLADAHALGVIHRDVKPDNVWLEAPAGRVKLIDFGLARGPAVGADGAAAGLVVGTPAFMAPEQARGGPGDPRSDVYSLGVLLFRLVAGRLPFAGLSPLELLAAVLTDPPPAVADLNPAVPPPLARLIDRMLAKEPIARPPSALAVADELGRIAADLPPPAPLPVAADPTADTVTLTPTPAPPPPARRRTPASVLAGVAGLAGLAALLYAQHRPADPPAADTPPGPPPVVRIDGPPPDPTQPAGRFPPLDAGWVRRVQAAPADEQAGLLADELVARNPRLDRSAVANEIEGGVLAGLSIVSPDVADLSPVRAIPGLTRLTCAGPAGHAGTLADLGPLAGLRLARLDVSNNPVADLAPLRRMPLAVLVLRNTAITDLEPVRSCPLRSLDVSGSTRLTDLSPLAGADTLVELTAVGCPVRTFEPLRGLPRLASAGVGPGDADPAPLAGSPLRTLLVAGFAPPPDHPLRRCPTLATVNGRPAAEFWARADRRAAAGRAVPQRVLRPAGEVRRLAVSADGGLLAAGGDDVRAWDLPAGRPVPVPGQDRVGEGLIGFAGGRRLAARLDDNKIHVRDPAGGPEATIGAAAFGSVAASSPAGVLAVINGERVVVLAPDGRELTRLDPPGGHVVGLAFAADGAFLAAATDTGAVRVWAAVDWSEHATLAVGGTPRVAFAPAGHALAATTADAVTLWADAGRAEVGRWAVPGAVAAVPAADGRRVAVGLDDGWVEVREPDRDLPVRTFEADRAPVTAVEFARHGAALVTAHGAGEVRVWDWPQLLAPPAPPPAGTPPPGFTPLFDGRTLAGWRPGFRSPPHLWAVRDGSVVYDPPRGADRWGWLVTDREFGPFELRLRYRWLAPGGDSGVAFWADLDHTPASTGVEVLLADDANFAERNPDADPAAERTGGLWRIAPAERSANRPLGEWNELRVRAAGGRVRVEQNGTVLTDAAVDDLRRRVDGHLGLARGRGRIGLQANKGAIEFRDVWVKHPE